MDTWISLESFPGYSVSNQGFVRNDQTDRWLKLQLNQSNQTYIGLMQHGRQVNRVVAKLVIEAFVGPHPNEHYNTVIHLDGDVSNNKLTNLLWRPRWFAIQFHSQFIVGPPGDKPVRDRNSGTIYEDALKAATAYGLLAADIFNAAFRFTHHGEEEIVWPVHIPFELVV